MKNNSDYETRGENNDQILNLWIPLISRLDVSAYSFIISLSPRLILSDQPLVAFIASLNALPSFGGSGKPGFDSITIAFSGQPVAQAAHPKHLLKSTSGKSSLFIVLADEGHLSIQVLHDAQVSGSS